ncbi:CXC [Nesidiocoris tenuis]|uniref:CXC n=1 Tax=Nesidiocoris tenuis TaxID=355587 RepID=A0ABN7AKD8_9HEMI|nr:CXC [Nesidiocoris tenuis]
MNPTSLYVSTCRLILQAGGEDSSSWQDIHKLLPSLRQSLSCTVCGHLLMEPYTPTDSNCQHHVCRSCRGGRKKLRPSCGWCKDYSKYIENVQLRTLLQCYKKLCSYVTHTDFYRSLDTEAGSSTVHNSTVENNQALVELLKEGAGFKDEYKNKSNGIILPLKNPLSSLRTASTQTLNFSLVNDKRKRQANGDTTYSIISCSNDNGNRLTIKRTASSKVLNGNSEGDKSTKVNKVRKRSVFMEPQTCKCGVGTNPKGACRGYRCPCYSSDNACNDCYCVGCKNPRGVSQGKVYPGDQAIKELEKANAEAAMMELAAQ